MVVAVFYRVVGVEEEDEEVEEHHEVITVGIPLLYQVRRVAYQKTT